MSINVKSQLYFEKNWGVFIGHFSNNLPHKHFAIQVSVTSDKDLIITDDQTQKYYAQSVVIQSNVLHKLDCDSPHLVLLIYPTTILGHYLKQFTLSTPIESFQTEFSTTLRKILQTYLEDQVSFDEAIKNIQDLIATMSKKNQHQDIFEDERIKTAIHYLEHHFDRVVSLQEIADECCLSPSRFLHLFKKQTGITFRRIQLWHKISQSFQVFPQQNITQTAHQFGFTDSAHYSKVFKDTFGFSPKVLMFK